MSREVPKTAAAVGRHYSVDFERNDDGWWPGRCVCGWDGGFYPEAEDAADG